MTVAYVMIKTAPGKEREVFEHLSNVLKTKQKDLVFGPYDIVVKVKTKTNEDLQKLVNQKIRSSLDVVSTLTLTCYGIPERREETSE